MKFSHEIVNFFVFDIISKPIFYAQKLLRKVKVAPNAKSCHHNRDRPTGEGKDYHPYSSSVPCPFRLFFYLLIQSTPDDPNSEKVRVTESSKQITGNKQIRKWISLRKHPFLLALRRWGRFARRKRPQRRRARRNGCCRRLQMDGEGMHVSRTLHFKNSKK